MKKLSFYQIEAPTTQQIFNAIINNEYTPLEKIMPKAKQINILLKDYFNTNNVLVTFTGVTNSGGCPVFLSEDDSLYEIAADQNKDFYNLSEEDQDNEVELLGCYLRTYNDVFNLN